MILFEVPIKDSPLHGMTDGDYGDPEIQLEIITFERHSAMISTIRHKDKTRPFNFSCSTILHIFQFTS